MERTQFTFYDSFFRAIGRIKSKIARCDAYDALCQYALYGIEPDIDSMPSAAAIAFESFKPNLDAGRRKAQSGSAGGKSKQTASKPEANDKQTASKEYESKNKNKDKKKNKNKDKCLKGDFDLFWEAYPRKEGKQKAETAFAKVTEPVQVLLDAIEAQKKSAQWTKDGGQFIPHPATWLNGKRWLDEVVVAAETRKGVPMGGTGELGSAEMAAIAKLMGDKDGVSKWMEEAMGCGEL